MKFLLDVNASGTVANCLIQLGHDVVEVGRKDPRMSDNEILSWAVRESRIIITTDNDFEEMIWRQGKPHCGLLRLENLPRSERIKLPQAMAYCLSNFRSAGNNPVHPVNPV